jgi:hypothetical protein
MTIPWHPPAERGFGGNAVPITHTNRKGVVYYLCRGTTAGGKPRYYASRRPNDDLAEAMPAGHAFAENVNGQVSVGRPRPSRILPDELRMVEAALRRHPHPADYRLADKRDRIEIYERSGTDPDDFIDQMARDRFLSPGRLRAIHADIVRTAHYAAVARFLLVDERRRTFRAERWCYLGSIDDWIPLNAAAALLPLVRRLVPLLGTQELFDLTYYDLSECDRAE